MLPDREQSQLLVAPTFLYRQEVIRDFQPKGECLDKDLSGDLITYHASTGLTQPKIAL